MTRPLATRLFEIENSMAARSEDVASFSPASEDIMFMKQYGHLL